MQSFINKINLKDCEFKKLNNADGYKLMEQEACAYMCKIAIKFTIANKDGLSANTKIGERKKIH
jgi:hypothetical protein